MLANTTSATKTAASMIPMASRVRKANSRLQSSSRMPASQPLPAGGGTRQMRAKTLSSCMKMPMAARTSISSPAMPPNEACVWMPLSTLVNSSASQGPMFLATWAISRCCSCWTNVE